MSNSADAGDLIFTAQLYSRYTMYTILIFGVIGNVLNIVVFTKLKIFRLNRCAFYLIAESFVNLGQLNQIFITEIWKLFINGTDPTNVSPVWCKLKNMFLQWFRLMLSSIVCFVAIDQYLSTNHVAYLRQFSSLKLARYEIRLTTFLCLLHTVPFIVFLHIQPPLGCIITNISLTKYYSDFFYPFLNGLLPICLATLFSILAYRNVRRIVRRQLPMDRRKLDQQLTAMIFVRVIFYVLLLLPYTIYRIFALNLNIVAGNTLAYATEYWIQVISTTLVYFNHAVNFYIFLATSTRYRRQVKYCLMKKCRQTLKQWRQKSQNKVHPSDGLSFRSGIDIE